MLRILAGALCALVVLRSAAAQDFFFDGPPGDFGPPSFRGDRGTGDRGDRGGGDRGDRGSGFGRGDRGSGFGRFGGSGDRGRSPFSSNDFLQRLDANGDGSLDPREVPDRMRPFVDRAARQAGVDPSRAISLRALRGGSNDSRRGGSREEGPPMGFRPPWEEGPPRGDDSRRRESSGSDSSSTVVPGVPGFDLPDEQLPPVPGFGGALTAPVAAIPRGEAGRGDSERRSSTSSGDSPSSSGPPASGEDRTRRYAESLLRQYDNNRNGVLEPDEWATMRGDPGKGDTDGDGKLTLDELSVRLSGGSRSDEDRGSGSRGGPSPGGPGPGGSAFTRIGPPRSMSPSGGTKPKRFLTPTERLPEGLPSWFARSDADADGQIMMAEYASTWSDAKVSEFLKYDLNADGVITPQECLAVEKKKP
jgi:hypothetical protein